MTKKTSTSQTSTLPDPSETDLVLMGSFERQLARLRSTVDNLNAVSQEQEACNQLLKKDNEKLRQQVAELQEPSHEATEVAALKVRIYALRNMLSEQNITLANTDRSKIARYIAFMVGSSERYVDQILADDKPLTTAHNKSVETYHKLAKDLGLPVNLE